MKKLFPLLALAAGILTFSSCGKDKTEPIPKSEYTITVSVGSNGTMSLNGVLVNNGSRSIVPANETRVFTFTPAEGYLVDKVTYNGRDVTGELVNGTYTTSEITADVNVSVTFVAKAVTPQYTITVNVGSNGTVSLGGNPVLHGQSVSVWRGETRTFTITPVEGYLVDKITYNGQDVTAQLAGGTYTTPGITANATLSVTFKNDNTLVYNNAQVAALRAFLEQPSAISGRRNVNQVWLGAGTIPENLTGQAWLSNIAWLTWSDDAQNKQLVGINWPGKSLSGSLNFSAFTALKNLQCFNNGLTALNVSGCTALETLNCSNNQLTTLNVSGCTKLGNLQCFQNKLTALDASGLTALNTLYCYENQLKTLNIDGCTALRDLRCNKNQLTALDVRTCPINHLDAGDQTPTLPVITVNMSLGFAKTTNPIMYNGAVVTNLTNISDGGVDDENYGEGDGYIEWPELLLTGTGGNATFNFSKPTGFSGNAFFGTATQPWKR